MAETNTPFGADDKEALTATIDPDKNYHEELVGEGKKFKDDLALARSKVESDNHIANLERELRGIRDELKSRVDMETLVTELKTLSKGDVTNTEDLNNPEYQKQDEQTSSEQNPEQIEQLVNELVEKREHTNQLQRNLQEVTEKLASVWGQDAEQNWITLRKEMNMSEAELRSFASQKPQAMLKLAGAVETAKQPVEQDESLFSKGNVQSTVFVKKNTGVKNMGYYNQIKKSDPARYWSKEIQSEMHKNAQEQKEAFFTS